MRPTLQFTTKLQRGNYLADNSEKSFLKSLNLDVGCSSVLELLPGICEGHHPKHKYQEERAREKNERRGEARRRKMPGISQVVTSQ